MGERDAIDRVDEPVTVQSLVADLRELGIEGGETLLVHSSLSKLGWVSGGAPAVVDALMEAVTESGTLVLPTHTYQYSDPTSWSNPPVPESWVETIHESIPPFRSAVTPARAMGAIAECFRSYPGVVRSRHPELSFAAWGADAEAAVADHSFDHGLGEESPLARIYERDGNVLLLGVDHMVNTSIHLAEYRATFPGETVEHGAPVYEDGERVRVEYEDIVTSTDDFADLGGDFERQVGARVGEVGAAPTKLIDQPKLVDYAVEWFEEHRGGAEK